LSATQQLLRFGVFELNLATEELRKGGTNVKLPPQPFRLLVLLVSHAGQVVTREEIKKQLWVDETYVDFEHGVNKCIRQIRTALNDNAEEPLYLETLPRHGYCFLAPVVTKTVPGPALKVTPSASGIQSGIPTLIATQPSAPPNANAAVTPVAAAAAPAAEIAPTGRAGSRRSLLFELPGCCW
jgi:DNA-binding winged helix-turn-helix (wHTH) protein